MGAVYERSVDVRWRDTDALGHVNHVVFLTYLEEGRDAFYSQIIGGDPVYVVVRLEIDLRAEVRHQDRRVRGRIEAGRVGTTSLVTRETTLSASNDGITEARGVTPRRGASDRKTIPLNPGERARLPGL